MPTVLCMEVSHKQLTDCIENAKITLNRLKMSEDGLKEMNSQRELISCSVLEKSTSIVLVMTKGKLENVMTTELS